MKISIWKYKLQNTNKLKMYSLQSPNGNGLNKNEIIQSITSPTNYRNKRIPSAHDNYSYSSNHNLKICRI